MEEAHSDPEDLVRCLACRTVYRKPLDPDPSDVGEGEACPKCGAIVWLAVQITFPDTMRRASA